MGQTVAIEGDCLRVESRARRTPDVPGDFGIVYDEIADLVGGKLSELGLEIPRVGEDRLGRYGVLEMLGSTTSSVMVIQRNQQEESLVVKVLREPRNRVGEGSGSFWHETAGHPLFVWSGPGDANLEVGEWLQYDCLRGELERGVLYNQHLEVSPYLGLVGVRQDENGVEMVSESMINAENRTWPGLLMREIPMDMVAATIFRDWLAGGWEELDFEDMIHLLVSEVMAYDRHAISVSDRLRETYGSVDFLKQYMTLETVRLAAFEMERWFPGNRQIANAANMAKVAIDLMGQLLDENRRWFSGELDGSLVVGHADSKLSNTALAVRDKNELIGLIKARDELPWVLLDAQSLAAKGSTMYGKNPDDVCYAHWCIVPRTQQWAYALKPLLANGQNELFWQCLEELSVRQGVEIDDQRSRFILMQVAYKMMVEVLVNAGNYVGLDGDRNNVRGRHLRQVMEEYPQIAVKILRGLVVA